jgi:hypothetical protein
MHVGQNTRHESTMQLNDESEMLSRGLTSEISNFVEKQKHLGMDAADGMSRFSNPRSGTQSKLLFSRTQPQGPGQHETFSSQRYPSFSMSSPVHLPSVSFLLTSSCGCITYFEFNKTKLEELSRTTSVKSFVLSAEPPVEWHCQLSAIFLLS